MSKLKIFLYHLVIFVLGTIGIVGYLVYRLSELSGAAGLGGIIVGPVIILVYVVAFGTLCSVSFISWLLVRYMRNRLAKRDAELSK